LSNIVYLHGQPAPIPRFLRVSEHRRLEHLFAAQTLPYDRFVIEAGSLKEQLELFNALKQKGHELILDTNVAELSSIARYNGHAKQAPWSNPDGVLTDFQLKNGSHNGVIGMIARFAVSHGFSRVLAPARIMFSLDDGIIEADIENCNALRIALDAEGGKDIEIDFPVMVPVSILNDVAQRRYIISKLGSAAISSVWARISGFGASATGVGVRKYISSIQDFHALGKPIVSDGVGGLAALAILAFGGACGVSYGVASRERFDASDWHKPPKSGGGGGAGYNVLLSGIDKLLKREDAQAIIDAPGGRRLVSCADRNCCPNGFEDTIKDPKAHFLRQRAFKCDALAAVPEPIRARHYLDNDLTKYERSARQIAKLKIPDEKIVARLNENAVRLDRMRDVLGSLENVHSASSRSPNWVTSPHLAKTRKDRL
jgi:hypothetical protein